MKNAMFQKKSYCCSLTWPNRENLKLPSLISCMACAFWLFITEQIMPAMPLESTHNGIPSHKSCDGLTDIKTDEYFSPKIDFNCEFKRPSCGGTIPSDVCRTDFKFKIMLFWIKEINLERNELRSKRFFEI